MKTISKFVGIIGLISLGGCDGIPPEFTSTIQAPIKNVIGLEDCTYTKLELGHNQSALHIVRCPSSVVSVSARVGKHDKHIVAISPPVITAPTIQAPSPIMDPTSPTNAFNGLIDQAEARSKAENERKIELLRAEIERLKGVK